MIALSGAEFEFIAAVSAAQLTASTPRGSWRRCLALYIVLVGGRIDSSAGRAMKRQSVRKIRHTSTVARCKTRFHPTSWWSRFREEQGFPDESMEVCDDFLPTSLGPKIAAATMIVAAVW